MSQQQQQRQAHRAHKQPLGQQQGQRRQQQQQVTACWGSHQLQSRSTAQQQLVWARSLWVEALHRLLVVVLQQGVGRLRVSLCPSG